MPTPTDGSRIRTISFSVSGKAFIISVIRVLLVKNAALSVRLVLANSAILPNVIADKFIGLFTMKSLKLSTSDNLLEETNLLIVAVLRGGCFNADLIF